MIQNFCNECGTKLYLKDLDKEGLIPFCPKCQKFKFPMYNVAVSMIVKHEDKILLIKQYGNPFYVLVAGYVNIKEALEDACVRELKEEMNLDAGCITFNRTKYYEKSDTLMCNFTVDVADISNLAMNEEVDSYSWFSFEDALKNIKENSLAKYFLTEYINNL